MALKASNCECLFGTDCNGLAQEEEEGNGVNAREGEATGLERNMRNQRGTETLGQGGDGWRGQEGKGSQ